MSSFNDMPPVLATFSNPASYYSNPKRMVRDNMMAMDSRSFYVNLDRNSITVMNALVSAKAHSRNKKLYNATRWSIIKTMDS